MTENCKQINQRIACQRKTLGMNIAEFSKITGIQEYDVLYIEKGTRRVTASEIIMIDCAVLEHTALERELNERN